MHSDVFGNVPENHRLEVGHPLFKEVTLKSNYTLGYFVKGTLSLMNALDEPCRRTQLCLNIVSRFAWQRVTFSQSVLVIRTDPQFGHSIFIEQYHPFIVNLENVDIGADVFDVLFVEGAPRSRVQPEY